MHFYCIEIINEQKTKFSHDQKYKSLMNALLEGNDNGFSGFLVIQGNQLYY